MTPSDSLVLVVDDDQNVVSLIEQVLVGEGFSVRSAPSIFRAEGMVQRATPDLIILDRHLPDGDGAEFCVKLKKDERTQNIPVLFLSATKKATREKVKGLDVGGDDYLAKPFSALELTARVKAILRRSRPAPPKTVLEVGGLRMDCDARKVSLEGRNLELWPKEFELLRVFLTHPNKTLSRESILQLVWGPGKETERTPKVVDVTVSNLKKKLGAYGEKRIVSVRSFGFRFDVD